jgi:hypothetical protein
VRASVTVVYVTRRIASYLLPIVALITPVSVRGQSNPSPDSLTPIVSMGFPTRYHWYLGGMVGSDRRNREAEVASNAVAGFYRDLMQPTSGILGFSLEGYAGSIGGEGNGGMRAFLTSRAIRFALGEDFSFSDGTHNFIIRFEDPILRGGFFRTGSLMRFEWLPGRHHSYNIGLTIPLFQPWAGKTRPAHFDYRVPPASTAVPPAAAQSVPARRAFVAPAADAALARARSAALRIDGLTTAFPDAKNAQDMLQKLSLAKRVMQIRDADFPTGHTYNAEVDYYHRQIGLAFAAALGSDRTTATTDSLTAHARLVLLEQVLIPFDRRLGSFRSDDVIQTFIDRSKAEFTAWAVRSSLVPGSRRGEVISAYARLTDIVKEAHSAEHQRWHDSRLMWIPLQLALRPEEHETQSQIDALIEKLVDSPFERGSAVNYLVSELFTRELITTIRRTRDYHVLWIHDIKGGPSADEPDTVSAHVVIDGYLTALTRAVNAFGETRRIPTFLIFLDEWYYELANGRFWLELLQDPLRKDLRFGPRAASTERQTRLAVQALRAAVAASPSLQAEAAKHGQDWLRNLVSVHVSITNPGDPSFPGRLRARDLTLAFADDWMRDHRKIVFYDVTEDDPGRGGAIFTGEGVGAQYSEGAWEDRSLQVRGPAILPLKRYARELLTRQGFKASQIPPGLRAHPMSSAYATKIDSLVGIGWVGRVMTTNSSTGYDDKIATVAKAALYSLMPSGSRIIVPDSQWSSFLWGSMLAGAALRGCQVFIIGPGRENAPYGPDSWPMFALQRDIFSALINASNMFREEITGAGGALHVGIYEGEVGTRDFEARIREFSAGVRRNQFMRRSFPFPSTLYDLVEDPDSLFKAIGPYPRPVLANDTAIRPKLHLKSQLYVSREFVDNVLPLPQWHDIALSSLRARARQLAASPTVLGFDSTSFSDRANSLNQLTPLGPALRARTLAQRDSQVVYLTLGSQNQDDRSLLGNGEVLAVISGEAVLAGVMDYTYLVARATWLETQADLDRKLPPVSNFKRQLARWGRRLI